MPLNLSSQYSKVRTVISCTVNINNYLLYTFSSWGIKNQVHSDMQTVNFGAKASIYIFFSVQQTHTKTKSKQSMSF